MFRGQPGQAGKGGLGEGLGVKEDPQGQAEPRTPLHKETLACHPELQLKGLHQFGVQRGRLPRTSMAEGPTAANRPQPSPPAWPEVPSPRPEPLNFPQRSPGNSVSVFTPVVSASESFILTADCIKIPVVIGSGAVFSMRILNQAFCPRPE